MDKNDLKKALKNDFIYINKEKNSNFFEEIENLFEKYKNFLQKNNKIHNLTKLDDEKIIYEQYFYESLLPFKNIDLNNQNLLDIGSGSGIPGIALKIIYPSLKLTIIESNKKKINFMKDLANLLDLKNINFINQRAELVEKNLYEQFDVVTSRAVASLKILIEISTQFTKINGLIIEPKSLNYKQELNKIDSKFLNELGLEIYKIDKQKTNLHEINTIWFKKIKPANEKYPRAWNIIIKEK